MSRTSKSNLLLRGVDDPFGECITEQLELAKNESIV